MKFLISNGVQVPLMFFIFWNQFLDRLGRNNFNPIQEIFTFLSPII